MLHGHNQRREIKVNSSRQNNRSYCLLAYIFKLACKLIQRMLPSMKLCIMFVRFEICCCAWKDMWWSKLSGNKDNHYCSFKFHNCEPCTTLALVDKLMFALAKKFQKLLSYIYAPNYFSNPMQISKKNSTFPLQKQWFKIDCKTFMPTALKSNCRSVKIWPRMIGRGHFQPLA